MPTTATSPAHRAPIAPSTALLSSGENAIALARSRATLTQRARELEPLVSAVERAHADGDALLAAELAQIASRVACTRPAGILSLEPIERTLNAIGRALVPADPAVAPFADAPTRVLHVVTKAFATGGHTRVVERWIERDPRAATVVVTSGATVPDSLAMVISKARGRLVPSLPGADLIERARALRRLAAEHDFVVLHVHMHDVLPSLAFADPRGRPPVVHFEHASHQFWVGTAVADVIASMLPAAGRTAIERRGYPAERIARLPLPTAVRQLPSRADARRLLGITPERPVVLTIGSQWKVMPGLAPGMAELSRCVLDAVPDALHVVVGSRADASWETMRQLHPQGAVFPGQVADIGPLLAAADVYLDTWPISGGATILDVAAAELPTVSLTASVAGFGMLCAVDELGAGAIVTDSPAATGRAVAELMADPERRARMGRTARDLVDAEHGSGWGERLEALVATAVAHRGVARVLEVPADPTLEPWELTVEVQMSSCAEPTVEEIAQVETMELPSIRLPADPVAWAQVFAALTAPGAPARAPRALARMVLDAAAAGALVDRLRALTAAGEVAGCAIVVREEELPAGFALLQAALDAGEDVDIDIVTAPSLERVRTTDDLVLAWDAATATWSPA